MKKLPPLNSLRYFAAAAHTSSFKQAAKELHVTQAAISQHIKTLEAHLGVALFHRGVRKVTLTTEGHLLLPDIQAGFESFHRGIELLTKQQNANVLNITVVESLSTRWLVPRLPRFHKAFPEMRVRLEPENRVRAFAGSDLDLAIRFGEGQYTGLESRLLGGDDYVLVCHPSLLSSDITPDKLYQTPLLEEIGPITGEAWQQFINQYNLDDKKFSRLLEVEDSTVTIVDAALAGQGFAMLRYKLVEQQILNQQLVTLFNFSHKSHYSYYLVAPSHHFTYAKVAQFERWLRSEFDRG